MALVNSHGKEKTLRPLLLTGTELEECKQKSVGLPRVRMNSRETSDVIMLGIGAFTPLSGFMGKADWRSVCDACVTSEGFHLIVGRDHAGVGEYYGPFDSQRIFDEIPSGALELKPLKLDWTFYCHRCDGMASTRTCPHDSEHRLIVSGTMLRKTLAEGGEVPAHFSRPEVLAILQHYYASLDDKVEITLHKYARG